MDTSNAITTQALNAMNVKIDDNRVAYASSSSLPGAPKTPTKKPDPKRSTSGSQNQNSPDVYTIDDNTNPHSEDHDDNENPKAPKLSRRRKVAFIDKMEAPNMPLYVRLVCQWLT